MLEYTNIKGTTLMSSRIALGTWAIGGWMWGGTDEKESIRTIHAALDQGIHLIDTAPIYDIYQVHWPDPLVPMGGDRRHAPRTRRTKQDSHYGG